jgi:hypothetical protein
MLLPELDNRHHHREKIDMARHTKMKIAALATTLVATLGMAAISPATASHSGKVVTSNSRDNQWCC